MNANGLDDVPLLATDTSSVQAERKQQVKGKGKIPVSIPSPSTGSTHTHEGQEAARLAKERIAQRRKQEEDWAKEAVVTIHKVVLNSFVKFGAGLTIQHVICGFEASRILIKNLPMDARKSEIIELFTQQGIDAEDLAILRTENVDGHQQATILGKAADVEVVALGLDGIEFRDENLEFVICERTSESRMMGSPDGNSCHLNIFWRAPPQVMIARYPGLEAWKVSQNLNGRLLGGQQVSAVPHWEPISHDARGLEYASPTDAVKISNIPAGTTIAEVQAFVGSQAVEPYPNTPYTSNQVLNALNTYLRSIPNCTLQNLTLKNSRHLNLVFARAFFGSWDSVRLAHVNLTGRTLRRGFPPLRSFPPSPYRFVLTVDENQYNAQETEWTELCSGKGKKATIKTRTVDRAGRRKVIITLLGHDKKAVGALKVRIESMASGQKLDTTYWHPSFKDAKGQTFFDDLYHSTGAYVRRDRKHNCIAVSGRTEAVETARVRIKEEVERISAEQWTIPLQRQALGFFIREGLAKMRGLLGEENVTLDVGSAKIVLHGADLEEARHHLRQLMDTFMDRSPPLTTASDDTLCPICCDIVSQPIEIGCHHIYCSSCLRHYILSTLDNHDFPLKCMGNDATCSKPLSLPLIQKFLPPQRFEQLVEAAFSSYIDKHPETFKYCNTPGCSQIYRTTTSPHELQCPSCFSEVCTACHDESHTGMTCVEKRLSKDLREQERLFQEWVMESGVKKCPSCQAWVEKMEGCNHMSCKCGTHFCWFCLGVFDQFGVYDHMTRAHGGIYNNPEPRANPGQPAAAQPQQNHVPDIVEFVGGPAAAAEQMAAFRRLEAERANRVQPGALPVGPAVRGVARAPLAGGIEGRGREALRNLQRYHWQAEEAEGQQARREAEDRREFMTLRNQGQRTGEANHGLEVEENESWCAIM